MRAQSFCFANLDYRLYPAVLEKIDDITTKWKGPNLGLSSVGTYF